MSAKVVSYAAVLRNAAEHADIRARDAVGPRTAAHYSAEAAALRALAALIDKATTGATYSDNPPSYFENLVATLAAGYTPPEDT